jgi:intracellular multiplication protein IcmP
MAAPPQGNQSDHSTGILWGVVAVFVTTLTVWYTLKAYFIKFYLTVKLYEINFLSIFTGHYFDDLRMAVASALVNPGKVDPNAVLAIGETIGNVLRFPLIILLLALAFIVYLTNATASFKRTYSLRDLARLERVNWPQITPVIRLDLIKVDIDSGAWAMAMTPLQFCKKFNLLEEVRSQRYEGMHRRDWDRVEVVLKRGDASQLLALQLGQLWVGVDRLPMHVKALFAVFAARINSDSKAAASLLAKLASSSGGKSKLNFKRVNELCKKHAHTKAVQKITQSHAYVYTVMASMLENARIDGVQASADFLWLKPMDRRLWYVLNTVGRQTPFVEVAGVFAHWAAEKEAGVRLLVPLVEEATKALELALKEVIYRRDEE